MKDKIIAYIKRIDLVEQSCEALINEILEFINSLITTDIADVLEEVGTLFYRSVSKLDQDKYSEDTESKIIDAFENIATLSVENKSNSELRTIYFLQRIYSKKSANIIEVDYNSLESEFTDLLENLDQIRILFKLKKEGTVFFPISNLLFDVVKCDNLHDEVNYVKTLQTLMLALQIFNSDDYIEEFDRIKNIIDNSKLTFASYLLEYSERIGGRDWIKNYEKNGVLILYNPTRKKVLIRNVKRDYFDLSGKEEYQISCIQTEKNNNEDPIAYYVEYELNNLKPINIFEELKQCTNFICIHQILNIIINQEYYNIWSEGELVSFNNKIVPINPFSNVDNYIIYRDNEDKALFDNAITLLKPFMLNKIVGCGINYINLGSILSLQKIEKVELEKLDLSNPNLRFNQFVNNWIKACNEKEKSFNKFFQIYTEQLSYVLDKNNFIGKEYEGEYFLPYRIEENIMDSLGICDHIIKTNIVECICEEDFFGDTKKVFIKGTKKDITEYKKICDNEDEQIKGEFWGCLNESEKNIYVGTDLDVYIKVLQKIKAINEKLLPDELINVVSEIHINYLKSCMKLHIKAWNEIHPQLLMDSIVRFRLANHLLLFNFNETRFNQWFVLIKKHDIVDYSIISNSKIFDINKKGIFYVVKDRSKAQSTLKDINYEYISSNAHRDKTDLFDPSIKIDTKSGYFTQKGEVINEVCFLFDIIQKGGATIETLKYYLNKKSKDDETHLQVHISGNRIRINEIIEKNKTTLSVYAIYSSKEGEKNVKDYLEGSGFEFNQPQSDGGIDKKLDSNDKKLIEEIYGRKYSGSIDVDDYIIFREFNQPKRNIVNKELLLPEKIHSLWVKRKELL